MSAYVRAVKQAIAEVKFFSCSKWLSFDATSEREPQKGETISDYFYFLAVRRM